jgi:hypothetical protein
MSTIFDERAFSGRVTRLGEFSPNRRLFTLGGFSKITEAGKNVGVF